MYREECRPESNSGTWVMAWWWVLWIFFLQNISSTWKWRNWQPRKPGTCMKEKDSKCMKGESLAFSSQRTGKWANWQDRKLWDNNHSTPARQNWSPALTYGSKDWVRRLPPLRSYKEVSNILPGWHQKWSNKELGLSSLPVSNKAPPHGVMKTTWAAWIAPSPSSKKAPFFHRKPYPSPSSLSYLNILQQARKTD